MPTPSSSPPAPGRTSPTFPSRTDSRRAWDVLRGSRPDGRRVVVADWGGDASGLDAAELLAASGYEVALAVGSAAFGETLHAVPAQPLCRAPLPGRDRDLAPPRARCVGRRPRPLHATSSPPSSKQSWRPTRSCSRSVACPFASWRFRERSRLATGCRRARSRRRFSRGRSQDERSGRARDAGLRARRSARPTPSPGPKRGRSRRRGSPRRSRPRGRRRASRPGRRCSSHPSTRRRARARAVADRDPDLAHVRRRLGERDLDRPLTLRAREEREVRRDGDQVGAGEREPARELRKVEVVADRHADPAERRLDDRRRLAPRLEAELLAVPEVRLPVDGQQPGRPERRRRSCRRRRPRRAPRSRPRPPPRHAPPLPPSPKAPGRPPAGPALAPPPPTRRRSPT